MNLPVRYRPQTFRDLVGQDAVARVLQNALRENRVAPVYLFAGPRGVGKTTTARILAKALNCAQGITPEPCGTCPSCVSIQQGRSLSVVEMDAASNRGIDDIREIREKIQVLPPDGRFKVYIIDEAHMLTREAFNALLKTLEEPPPHVVFVLATTEPHRIPETVQSRAQRLDFRPISRDRIAQRLMEVARAEGIPLTEEGALEIARHARGGLRDALRSLELVSLYGGEGALDARAVREALGLPPEDLFRSLLAALEEGDAARAWSVVEEGRSRGLLPRDWVAGLAEMLEETFDRAFQGEAIPAPRLLAWSRFLLEHDALQRYTRFEDLLFRYTLYRMAHAANLVSLRELMATGGYPHRPTPLHNPPLPPTTRPPKPDAQEKPTGGKPPTAPLPRVFQGLEALESREMVIGVVAHAQVDDLPDRVVVRYRNGTEEKILREIHEKLEQVAGKPVVLEHDRPRALLFDQLNLEEVGP